MTRPLPLVAILALTFSIAQCVERSDVFSKMPSTEPVYVRERQPGPLLECAVKPEYKDRSKFEIHWTRFTKNAVKHISRNSKLHMKTHYELVEDEATGEYSLRLKQVQRGITDGNFQCSVVDQDGEEFVANTAQVVVLLEPGEPTIIAEPREAVNESEVVTVKCASDGGSPVPTFRWTFANMSAVDSKHHIEVTDDATQRTVSTFQWRARPEENGAFLSCSVWNKALPEGESKETKTARLNILYKPRVQAGQTKELLVEEGESTVLACSAEGNPAPPSFKWKHVTSGESHDSARWVFQAEKRLAGAFECHARNSLGEGVDTIHLDVLYGPRVIVKERVNPAEGDSVILECEVDANPEADSIIWTGPKGFSQRGAKITIPSINRDQSGNYTCTATNRLQSHSKMNAATRIGTATTVVDVKRRPGPAKIVARRRALEVGENIELECGCEDEGSPKAAFVWSSPTSGGQFGTPEHDKNTLIIQNAQLSDNGVYRCRPFNELGQGPEDSVTITVIERAKLTRPLATERIFESGEVAGALECEAQGYPTPKFQWLKNGQRIDARKRHSRFMIEENTSKSGCAVNDACTKTVESRLAFRSGVEWFDKGNYSCVVENGAAAGDSTWTVVKVSHPPVILNELHAAGSEPHALAAANLRETAELTCLISARPEPTIRWLHESVQLNDGEGRYSMQTRKVPGRIDEYEAVLRIAELQQSDYGDYLCRAGNSKGPQADVKIALNKKTKPQKPSRLEVMGASAESLLVTWKAGFDGGYRQDFRIECRAQNPFTSSVANEEVLTIEVNNATELEVLDSETDTPQAPQPTRVRRQGGELGFQRLKAYNITSLRPLTKYFIRIKASNKEGQTDYTAFVTANTKDVVEDERIAAPNLLHFDNNENAISFEPVPKDPSLCVLVYVGNKEAGDWHTVPCQTIVGGEVKLEAAADQFKARFCRKSGSSYVCSASSPVLAAAMSMAGSWRLVLVIPIAVLTFFVLLLFVLLIICCRWRRFPSKDSKSKSNAIADERRPQVSGPFVSNSETKSTMAAHSGSLADSGVFTLGSGQQQNPNNSIGSNNTAPTNQHGLYSGPGYSSNETGVDMWPGPDGYDLSTDPYLNDYDASHFPHPHPPDGYPVFYEGFMDGGHSDSAPHSFEDGDESDGAYSSGGRRVMKEIIV